MQDRTPSGQTASAAERSAHVTRGSAPSASDWPVVELSPGVYRLRVVVEMEAEIARLRAELQAKAPE